jgi:hypothetical protein
VLSHFAVAMEVFHDLIEHFLPTLPKLSKLNR